MAGQTLLPDEVIIVDDCSTDDTEKVVFELLQKHKEIRYFRLSKNSGTAVACNVAIEKASGKYITRIDSDDMRESWSFEKMMEAQLANPHSYIYDNVMIFVNGQRKGKEWKMFDYDFDKLLERNTNHSGIMFPKVAWEESGGYPKDFNDGRDDWAFNVALGIVGYCGVHIGGPGYLYRREQQNRTVKNSSPEYQRYYRIKMEKNFKDIYSGRFPMSCCGNRRSSNTLLTSSTPMKLSLAGAEGMTMLLYEGDNYGLETYFGPVTGTAYVFSKKKNIRNVDSRDLTTPKRNGLLDLSNHGKPVFSVYQREPAPAPVQAPKPIVEEPLKVFENVTTELDEIKEEVYEEPEQTKIEPGQVTYVGKLAVSRLEKINVTTWEEFMLADEEVLAKAIGKTTVEIEKIKKEISE